MDTGIGFFATDDAIRPAALARLVEEHGHAALYFPEHSHIPASRESPYAPGGELPRKYAHAYDLFVAMTAAAAATSRLRIGSGICLVTERDPIHTAKEGRERRPSLRRTRGVRRRRRLKPRGDGQPAPTRACGWRSCASASRR